MNEDLVLHILNTACYGLNLAFSLIPQAPYLYIFFDRAVDQVLDYSTLTETIRQAVVSSGLPPEYEYLALYSRILGNEDPDWETAIYVHPIPDAMAETEWVEPEEPLQQAEFQAEEFQEAELQEAEFQPYSSAPEAIVLESSDLAAEEVEPTAPPIEAPPIESPPIESQIEIAEMAEFADLEGDLKTDLEEDKTVVPASEVPSLLIPPPPPAELMAPPPPLDEMAQFYFKAKSKPKMADPVLAPPATKTIVSISAKPISAENPPAVVPPIPEAETVPALVPQAKAINLDDIDLSSYCFIRNKLLLTSQIKPPSGSVISALKTFATLNAQEKQEAAQLLDKLFRQPAKKENEEGSGEAVLYQVGEVDVKNLVEPLQSWIKEVIDLDPESFRKSAIWFSRYCHNPKGTIAELGLN
jgi:hypothetical protein